MTRDHVLELSGLIRRDPAQQRGGGAQRRQGCAKFMGDDCQVLSLLLQLVFGAMLCRLGCKDIALQPCVGQAKQGEGGEGGASCLPRVDRMEGHDAR
ncbi:hypothetical protein ASE08_09685 [Rhizobacter sp. Root16D2]|nr:hypothetical protein ASE08_09685 [Rhizobacter sp. Root16D2]